MIGTRTVTEPVQQVLYAQLVPHWGQVEYAKLSSQISLSSQATWEVDPTSLGMPGSYTALRGNETQCCGRVHSIKADDASTCAGTCI